MYGANGRRSPGSENSARSVGHPEARSHKEDAKGPFSFLNNDRFNHLNVQARKDLHMNSHFNLFLGELIAKGTEFSGIFCPLPFSSRNLSTHRFDHQIQYFNGSPLLFLTVNNRTLQCSVRYVVILLRAKRYQSQLSCRQFRQKDSGGFGFF